MAISPSIPTSFVPRQQAPEQPRRKYSQANNIFSVVAYAILAVTVAAAGATYAYEQYLAHSLDSKSKALVAAQASVDQSQVQNFIELRDRLSSAQALLANHVTLSTFFDALERTTIQNVEFSTLSIQVASDRSAQVSIDGFAKDFNSLAVQSNALATQKGIKQAIFSGISVDKTSGVGFHLSALVDPALVTGGSLMPATSGGTVTVPAPVQSTSSTSPTLVPPSPIQALPAATATSTRNATATTTRP